MILGIRILGEVGKEKVYDPFWALNHPSRFAEILCETQDQKCHSTERLQDDDNGFLNIAVFPVPDGPMTTLNLSSSLSECKSTFRSSSKDGRSIVVKVGRSSGLVPSSIFWRFESPV